MLDGQEAVQLAAGNNIPTGTVIYFDMENRTFDKFYFPEWVWYYRGWAKAVLEAHYRYGIYAHKDIADIVITAFKMLPPSPTFRSPGVPVQAAPEVWIAEYPFQWIDKDGKNSPAETLTAKGTGIYRDGGLLLENPTALTYQTRPLGAKSWQFAGDWNLKWTTGSGKDEKSHGITKIDFCSSVYRDPGRPQRGDYS